mmetsp:Transcript_22837/g.50091  ORF Transcript_22837/g.50091 Transcript_22837/m.50091 type:complete len:84 (+) Transcript_22837:975-1226(+)
MTGISSMLQKYSQHLRTLLPYWNLQGFVFECILRVDIVDAISVLVQDIDHLLHAFCVNSSPHHCVKRGLVFPDQRLVDIHTAG